MEQMDLSKLGDDNQTVQKQTAPIALQLVSNIAQLNYTHKNCEDYWSRKYIAFAPVNIVIYSIFELH